MPVEHGLRRFVRMVTFENGQTLESKSMRPPNSTKTVRTFVICHV